MIATTGCAHLGRTGDSALLIHPYTCLSSVVHNHTIRGEGFVEFHTTDTNFLRWIMVPVEIPAVLQGRPQRLKRMSVDYMVTNSTPRTTRIISSEILMSDRRGRSEKIYSDKQERGATVWTTFDLVVPNPPVITGSLFLRVTMQYAERQAPDYENKPKGDRVFIGTIGAVIGD